MEGEEHNKGGGELRLQEVWASEREESGAGPHSGPLPSPEAGTAALILTGWLLLSCWLCLIPTHPVEQELRATDEETGFGEVR